MSVMEILPWLVTATIAALSLIFGRTDKSSKVTSQMQIDIAQIKVMLEQMQQASGAITQNQKDHQERNSARHAELFERLENLEKRMLTYEHERRQK